MAGITFDKSVRYKDSKGKEYGKGVWRRPNGEIIPVRNRIKNSDGSYVLLNPDGTSTKLYENGKFTRMGTALLRASEKANIQKGKIFSRLNNHTTLKPKTTKNNTTEQKVDFNSVILKYAPKPVQQPKVPLLELLDFNNLTLGPGPSLTYNLVINNSTNSVKEDIKNNKSLGDIYQKALKNIVNLNIPEEHKNKLAVQTVNNIAGKVSDDIKSDFQKSNYGLLIKNAQGLSDLLATEAADKEFTESMKPKNWWDYLELSADPEQYNMRRLQKAKYVNDRTYLESLRENIDKMERENPEFAKWVENAAEERGLYPDDIVSILRGDYSKYIDEAEIEKLMPKDLWDYYGKGLLRGMDIFNMLDLVVPERASYSRNTDALNATEEGKNPNFHPNSFQKGVYITSRVAPDVITFVGPGGVGKGASSLVKGTGRLLTKQGATTALSSLRLSGVNLLKTTNQALRLPFNAFQSGKLPTKEEMRILSKAVELSTEGNSRHIARQVAQKAESNMGKLQKASTELDNLYDDAIRLLESTGTEGVSVSKELEEVERKIAQKELLVLEARTAYEASNKELTNIFSKDHLLKQTVKSNLVKAENELVKSGGVVAKSKGTKELIKEIGSTLKGYPGQIGAYYSKNGLWGTTKAAFNTVKYPAYNMGKDLAIYETVDPVVQAWMDRKDIRGNTRDILGTAASFAGTGITSKIFDRGVVLGARGTHNFLDRKGTLLRKEADYYRDLANKADNFYAKSFYNQKAREIDVHATGLTKLLDRVHNFQNKYDTHTSPISIGSDPRIFRADVRKTFVKDAIPGAIVGGVDQDYAPYVAMVTPYAEGRLSNAFRKYIYKNTRGQKTLDALIKNFKKKNNYYTGFLYTAPGVNRRGNGRVAAYLNILVKNDMADALYSRSGKLAFFNKWTDLSRGNTYNNPYLEKVNNARFMASKMYSPTYKSSAWEDRRSFGSTIGIQAPYNFEEFKKIAKNSMVFKETVKTSGKGETSKAIKALQDYNEALRTGKGVREAYENLSKYLTGETYWDYIRRGGLKFDMPANMTLGDVVLAYDPITGKYITHNQNGHRGSETVILSPTSSGLYVMNNTRSDFSGSGSGGATDASQNTILGNLVKDVKYGLDLPARRLQVTFYLGDAGPLSRTSSGARGVTTNNINAYYYKGLPTYNIGEDIVNRSKYLHFLDYLRDALYKISLTDYTIPNNSSIPYYEALASLRRKYGGKLIPKAKTGIHIKKENRGKFTSYCGGKVTDACIKKAKASGNPTLVKRATFAENARKWKH